MLEKNDYPTDTCTIEKSKKSKKGSIQRNGTLHQQKGKTYRDGVLSLPYIADEVTWRVRKAVKRSGLNIHIAQRSGPTLKSILTRSALEPPRCPNQGRCMACQAGLEGRCTTKNAIYKLECTLCSDIYIRETKTLIRERFLEHPWTETCRTHGEHWTQWFIISTYHPIFIQNHPKGSRSCRP